MKIYILPIILLLSQLCQGQEYKIDSLFKVLQDDIAIERLYNNGNIIFDNDTQKNYYLLLKVSPVDSLVKYVNNPDPAIRCYIFIGLVRKNADEKVVNEIQKNHLYDSASYKSASNQWKVNEFMQSCLKRKNELSVDYAERSNDAKQQFITMFQGERHGLISKSVLLKADSLNNFEGKYKIASFTMTIKKDSTFITKKSSDNKFTHAMKKLISKSEIGSRIWFEDIKVLGPLNEVRCTGSMALRIKQ